MSSNKIIGKKVGTVSVHMYKEPKTNAPFFYIESENQEVLPISYVVSIIFENVSKFFKH